MIPTSAEKSEHRGPIRPPGDRSASLSRSAASNQALDQMKNELAPLRLSPELRSHSPSTSTQLQQGGSPAPVVCERKVSESDFRDVHRGELLYPGRRASDDSGLRTLGPANSPNSPSSLRPSAASSIRPSPSCSSASSPEPVRLPNGSPLAPNPGRANLSPLSPPSPRLSPSHRRRHSISSAAAIVRYVEWTPEDSDSRRRGRLVVESERNVDFASRQAARRQALGSSASSRSPLEMEWAAGILRQNFLFMHLSTTTLHQLLQCMEEVTLRAGQTLFEVGDCDDCLYLLVSGQMNTEPRAKVRVRVRARVRAHLNPRPNPNEEQSQDRLLTETSTWHSREGSN